MPAPERRRLRRWRRSSSRRQLAPAPCGRRMTALPAWYPGGESAAHGAQVRPGRGACWTFRVRAAGVGGRTHARACACSRRAAARQRLRPCSAALSPRATGSRDPTRVATRCAGGGGGCSSHRPRAEATAAGVQGGQQRLTHPRMPTAHRATVRRLGLWLQNSPSPNGRPGCSGLTLSPGPVSRRAVLPTPLVCVATLAHIFHIG